MLASRLPLLAGLGVSLLSLLLYLVTLSPTVNFIDSGELITVGATAGIAHPPGYPLYTLLTIVGAALPFVSAAVGVNLVSALSGALAVGLFYALTYELVRYQIRSEPLATLTRSDNRAAKRAERANGTAKHTASKSSAANEATSTDWTAIGVAAGVALLLCASTTFWNWSTEAKNYSLHYVFVSGLLLLALRARREVYGAGQPGPLWPTRQWPTVVRTLVLLAAATGLAFTNHPMVVLLVPVLAVLLFWPQPLSLEVRAKGAQPDALLWRWMLKYAPWLFLAGLVPLVIYLYLPIRSAQQPILNWGSPDNFGDFWRHITLSQSRGLLGRPLGGPLDFLGRAISMWTDQLGLLLAIVLAGLAVAGIVKLARSGASFLAASALLVVLTIYQTYNFQNAEVAAYAMPMFMMILAWAGVGLYWLLTIIAERMAPQHDATQQNRPGWLAAIPLVLALVGIVWNFGRAGHANNYLAESYVRNQFKSFAPNAVVITNNWYLTSPGYYLQYVLKDRPDVAIINRKLLQNPWYMSYLRRQYPEVMATVKEIADPFIEIEGRWINGEQVDSQAASQLYFQMLSALIDRNTKAGRPVYLQWIDPGQEEQFIAKDFSTHPEGMALRVDAQPFIGSPTDPQFDWRGILTDTVPMEDIATVVIDEYPVVLDRLAAFARQNNHPTEAANFAAQAAQIRQALSAAGR
ncbi:MAG: DUF2723 domain-containing protein [Chloroflexota bacterium]